MLRKINPEALNSLHKMKERKVILGKHQDPTWIRLMDHVHECFETFEGVKGFYNINTGEWAFVMTDAGRAHELLSDALVAMNKMKYFDKRTGLFYWKEPIDWVAFTIGNRGDYVSVRSTYYTKDTIFSVDLTPEKKAAIEYRLREEALPKFKTVMYDEYPYHKSPRVVSSFDDTKIDVQRLYDYGDRYFTSGNGSFLELVYRLRGKAPLESCLEFEERLEEE